MSKLIPYTLSQNPAPNPANQGQAYQQDKNALVQDIMAAFRSVLPSNYVATTNGPWYSLQFQAMAEQLAEVQINASQLAVDCAWDFTRPDFLWDLLGGLVFPNATDKSGIPWIDGDTDYRTFLRTMVDLLLQGATKNAIQGGIEALDPNVTAYITERYLETPPRDPNGGYTMADQFAMDILIDAGNQFPASGALLEQNVSLVLRALKPAHVICSYSVLFRDSFQTPVTDNDAPTWDVDQYRYEDIRKSCLGAREISGDAGAFLARRDYFSDPTKSFASIPAGAILANTATREQFRVRTTRALLSGADATPRAYLTSPSGLTGMAIVLNATDIQDTAQDWGTADEGETVVFLTGPNSGATYRLDTVLGSNGGPITQTMLRSGDTVRLAPTILVLDRRASAATSGVDYTVSVDRLGAQAVRETLAEEATSQFWL
jgi:hypothetical protein